MADRKIAIVKNGEQVASFPGDSPWEIVGDTLRVHRPTQTVHFSPSAWDFLVEDRDDLAQSPVADEVEHADREHHHHAHPHRRR